MDVSKSPSISPRDTDAAVRAHVAGVVDKRRGRAFRYFLVRLVAAALLTGAAGLAFAADESFQIDETGTQLFVNVPDARDIDVVDLAAEATLSLSTEGLRSNFPMAIDQTRTGCSLALAARRD